MRRITLFLLPMLLATGLGCGSGGAHDGAGGGTTSSTGTGTMGGGIPDPGTSDGVDNNFGDVEPNNTPQQATPLGVAMQGGVSVWVDTNDIGGSDNPADYFVFENGPAAGPFTFDICFTAPVTAMTATLWKVVSGTEQMPPIGTWDSTGTCVTDMTTPANLEASAEYLFGLTATGGVGSYSA
jgi:hypothetical protein